MHRVYAQFRLVASRWLWLMLALVLATICFGMIGFAGDNHHWSTDLYLVMLLFPLNCGEVAQDVSNWQLDVARWLGFLAWFSTIVTVLIKLFANRILEWFVRCTAKGHTIVAGLGMHGHELVARLLKLGQTVIVLAEDASDPQLESCRDAGAVVLIGNPASARLLTQAQLRKARRILVLFDDDHETLRVVTQAFQLLQPSTEKKNNPRHMVYCVAKVTEPGLQEVIHQHELYQNQTDFFSIRTINLYEICARSMLSRARFFCQSGELKRIAIIGLGEQGRLAETLIIRAAKDQQIDQSCPMQIHIYDLQAELFARELSARFPDLLKDCELKAHNCSSERCGVGCDDPQLGISNENFDAAFICIEDEALAAVQATKIGRLIKPAPVIVRTADSRTGLGALLQQPDEKGLGINLFAVGFHDLILDTGIALHTREALIAQACHEGYLRKVKSQIIQAEQEGNLEEANALRNKPANLPWEQLTKEDRDSNHAQVRHYSRHLEAIDPVRKPQAYGIFEKLSGHLSQTPRELFAFSEDEIEFLAEREHLRWMQDKLNKGWTYGPKRDDSQKHHNCLVPYSELDQQYKEYDLNVFRLLPAVLARANIFIGSIAKKLQNNQSE